MNKLTILLISIVTVLSCKKESEPPLLIVPVQNIQFPVNAAIGPPFTHYITFNDVAINTLQMLSSQGIDTADIQSIRPRNATLSVIFAESRLDFIDAVSIRLCPNEITEQNCGREAFYRDPVPFDAGFDLDLIPSNVDDLRELLLQNKINVQLKLERLRDFPQGSFNINLNMEFEVR